MNTDFKPGKCGVIKTLGTIARQRDEENANEEQIVCTHINQHVPAVVLDFHRSKLSSSLTSRQETKPLRDDSSQLYWLAT